MRTTVVFVGVGVALLVVVAVVPVWAHHAFRRNSTPRARLS